MSEFWGITLIILLGAISPGPDFAVVTKSALMDSRKSGIFAALGISTSIAIHSTYCLLGLAIVIVKSLILFSIVKYIGAAYLIYIGVKGLLSKLSNNDAQTQSPSSDLSNFQSFSQGLLCNLLNPKCILFLLSFFTLIIKPSMTAFTQMGYGLEIVLITFIWFSWLSVMITHPYVRARLHKIQYYVVKCMGIALIGFGLIAALH